MRYLDAYAYIVDAALQKGADESGDAERRKEVKEMPIPGKKDFRKYDLEGDGNHDDFSIVRRAF